MGETNKLMSALRQFKVLWINPVLRANMSGDWAATETPVIFDLLEKNAATKERAGNAEPNSRIFARGMAKGAATALIGIPVMAATAVVVLPFAIGRRVTGSAASAARKGMDRLGFNRELSRLAKMLEKDLSYCHRCSKRIAKSFATGKLARGKLCEACGPRIDEVIREAARGGAVKSVSTNATAEDILAMTKLDSVGNVDLPDLPDE